jgi:hypothetical protein
MPIIERSESAFLRLLLARLDENAGQGGGGKCFRRASFPVGFVLG